LAADSWDEEAIDINVNTLERIVSPMIFAEPGSLASIERRTIRMPFDI
jgi:hypothetical protein